MRDWLFVEDHCEAVRTVLAKEESGKHTTSAAEARKRNIEIVETICSILDQSCPDDPACPIES